MKQIIKNNTPRLYDMLKQLYHVTPRYKLNILKQKKLNEANRLKKEQEESKIMLEVFNNEYIVQNGHFKGMKYIKRSSGSALLPKILGSYEEPIQGWIREVIEDKNYENILDIGCAEGYYACGFAMVRQEVAQFDVG